MNKHIVPSVLSLNIALILLMIIGCSGGDRLWKETQRKDTIEGYEEYLTKKPDSEQVDRARTRIKELRQQLEKMKEVYFERSNRLKQYAPNVTTEALFLSDGWSPQSLYYRLIGVLYAEWNSTRSSYTLGNLDLDKEYPKAAEHIENQFKAIMKYRGGPTATFLPIYDYYSPLRDRRAKKEGTGSTQEASFARGTDSLGRYVLASHIVEDGMLLDLNLVQNVNKQGTTTSISVRSAYYVGPMRESAIEREVCRLVFERGILKEVSWLDTDS